MFDTNVVLSALLFGGRLDWLNIAWRQGAMTQIVCRDSVVELLRVLGRKKFRLSRAQQELLLVDYLGSAETVVLPVPLPALPQPCRDRNDEIFLHLAMAARADYLVTGDDDLLAMRGAAPVPIISAAQLKNLFEDG